MRLLYGPGHVIIRARYQIPGSKVYEGFRITEDNELTFISLLSAPEGAGYPGLVLINKTDVYYLKEVPKRNFARPLPSKEIDHPDYE